MSVANIWFLQDRRCVGLLPAQPVYLGVGSRCKRAGSTHRNSLPSVQNEW